MAEPNQPFVALTKLEAMEAAAVYLDQVASSIKLCSMLIPIIRRGNTLHEVPTEIREMFLAMNKSLVDPDLQIAAAKTGAQAIRDLILEERLVAARVEAGAGIGR